MENQTPFIWHELVTPDQKISGQFFQALFGWDSKVVDAGEYGDYTLFQKDGKDIAGMMNPTSDTPENGAFWHAYIDVDDINHCAEQTVLLGGKVLVPPVDIPDVGRICLITDPMGAVTHLMQPLVK